MNAQFRFNNVDIKMSVDMQCLYLKLKFKEVMQNRSAISKFQIKRMDIDIDTRPSEDIGSITHRDVHE